MRGFISFLCAASSHSRPSSSNSPGSKREYQTKLCTSIGVLSIFYFYKWSQRTSDPGGLCFLDQEWIQSTILASWQYHMWLLPWESCHYDCHQLKLGSEEKLWNTLKTDSDFLIIWVVSTYAFPSIVGEVWILWTLPIKTFLCNCPQGWIFVQTNLKLVISQYGAS